MSQVESGGFPYTYLLYLIRKKGTEIIYLLKKELHHPKVNIYVRKG